MIFLELLFSPILLSLPEICIIFSAVELNFFDGSFNSGL